MVIGAFIARLQFVHERNRFVSLVSRTCFNILPIARKGLTPETNPLPKMENALQAGK